MKIICSDDRTIECPVEEELDVLRSTAAQVLAQAVKRLYPEVQSGCGTATENGFRYDFDFGDINLTEEDLPDIEKEMQKIVQEDLPFRVFQKSKNEALKIMKARGEDYKAELISALPDSAAVSLCQQGDYIDLCAGPHLTGTEVLKAFKLTSLSEVYWKNDSKNKKLTRLSGAAFRSQAELREYEKLTETVNNRKKDPFSSTFIITYFIFTFLFAAAIFITASICFFKPWDKAFEPDYTITFANTYFFFAFMFSVAIYLFAISFFFWMWRKDIKPEKS